MRRQSGFWVAAVSALALGSLVVSATRSSADDDSPAWLGVYSQTLTPELREGLGYNGDGAIVTSVVPDSPADRAGLKQGDVIVGFNSTTIASSSGLARAVSAEAAGKSVSLRIVRDKTRRTLTATLAARPEDDETPEWNEAPETPEPPDAPAAPAAPRAPRIREFTFKNGDGNFSFEGLGRGLGMLGMGRGRLGVRVESLNPDLGGYFGVKDGKGVLVIEVLKDTPAERAGLKSGDVITRVGDKAVYDADDLVSALRDADKQATLTVMHKGASRTVTTELAEAPHVMRIDRSGPLGMRDGELRWHSTDGAGDQGDVRRQLDDLRRELRELRDQIKEMNHN
jgi:predicted metalloprotease with PDZ domain